MKILIYILFFSLCLTVNAEEKTRAIDLKAAYCIKAQKDFLLIISGLVQTDDELKSSMYQNPKNNNEKEFNQKIVKFNEDRIEIVENLKYIISRFEGYLNPRLKFIDKASILTAIKQVEKDGAMRASCMKKSNCNSVTESEKFDVCMSECNKKNGNIDKKVDECSDLSWMPY